MGTPGSSSSSQSLPVSEASETATEAVGMVLERGSVTRRTLAAAGGDKDMRQERARCCSPKVYPLPSCPNRLRNRSR